jgi:transcriptional regulator with XRE-family HTH domain
VSSKTDPASAARRRVRRQLQDLVADLRSARISLGLSQEAVARAAGVSRVLVGRIERLEIDRVPHADLGAIAGVLGLDLRIGAWGPAGDPLRDGVQVRLLEAFRNRLHPSLGWRAEVPLPGAGERRAWDAVVTAPDGSVGIEGISRFGAADATIRRVNLKLAADPRIERAVVVVNDTTRNREALRSALATVRADYPLQTREVLNAFEHGRLPRLGGSVLLRAPLEVRHPQAVHSGGKTVDASGGAGSKFVDKPVGRGEPGP